MRKHPLAECENCPLVNERIARTSGPDNASVVVVSRSPGVTDVQYGKPFSGASGQVLDHMLELYGYDRKDVKVTNLTLCYSEDPPQGAIAACRPRLLADIAPATTVIAAGAEAVRELIAKKSIKASRGIEHTKGMQRFIATNNPAAVLYDSDSFPNLVEDFKLALDPPPPVVYPQVRIVDTKQKAIATFNILAKSDVPIACDLEGHFPHIECVGFSAVENMAWVIPRHILLEVWDEFATLMESDKEWLWHNGVYDVKLLRANNIHTRIVQDTYPLSYALDERTEGVHGLSYLSRTQLGWLNYEPSTVEHYKQSGELPDNVEDLYTYNGYDCAATLQLFHLLRQRAIDDNVWGVYSNQSIPLLNALVNIELRGFHYDAIAAADLNEEIVIPKLRLLRSQIREITGLDGFMPSSPQQCAAFMYDTCGLKHKLKSTRKKSFERATGKEVRKEIMEGRTTSKAHYTERLVKFAALSEVFSQVNKQRGTYIEGLIKLVAEDGKLYCSFNPCGTVTRRLSSRVPNFQNITRTAKDVVPGIRTLFKPSPGNVIIQADYSQAELRCIARFSGDTELLAIYRDSNRSLHKETASSFYGANYTKDEYVKSKNINFGVCYGQSAFAFSQMYFMPKAEAQRYIDNWFNTFPGVLEWIKATHQLALSGDPIVFPFGGKRRFHLITEENMEEVKREAVNALAQNTASEFTIWSLCRLDSMGVPIISTVHDSIMADVPQADALEVALLMKQVMESAPKETLGWDDLPFNVDISMSEVSWGDCEDVELLLPDAAAATG